MVLGWWLSMVQMPAFGSDSGDVRPLWRRCSPKIHMLSFVVSDSEAIDSVVIEVAVRGGALRARLIDAADGVVRIAVASRAGGPAADGELCEPLAAALGVERSRVHVISGRYSTLKRVAVAAIDPGVVEALLARLSRPLDTPRPEDLPVLHHERKPH